MHRALIFITFISAFCFLNILCFVEEMCSLNYSSICRTYPRTLFMNQNCSPPSVQAFSKIIFLTFQASELPRPLKVGVDRHAIQNIKGVSGLVQTAAEVRVAHINNLTIFVHNSAILNKPPGYLRSPGLHKPQKC